MKSDQFVIIICIVIMLLSLPEKRGRESVTADDPDPLSVEEYLALIDTLTEMNENCLSPCWWDMNLGETGIETFAAWLVNEFAWETEESQQLIFEPESPQVDRILVYPVTDDIEVTLDRPTNDSFSVDFNLRTYPLSFIVRAFSQASTVTHIDLSYAGGEIRNNKFKQSVRRENLAPQSFFNTYGPPSNIFLEEGGVNRRIIIVYSNYHLFVSYRWQPQSLFTEDGNNLLFCFDLNTVQLFNLHAFSSDNSGETAFKETFSAETNRALPIEAATNMTIGDFVELFENKTIPCTESPIEIWFPE